jgi:protein NRD1
VDWDHSICPGNIKVLSRTLFIMGGFSEGLLRSHVEKFGAIQTCIVDKFKRRAFVKMTSRKDALNAREALGSFRSDEMQFQVRWGVGFGPRDCCDYESGISVIPIKRLTHADYKWLLTAEYGGTGDLPIQEGMVVEEPDIELGTGVSSKAISRRIVADAIGKRPRSGQVGRGRRCGRH